MSYLNTRVHDAALQVLTSEVNRLDICSAEPSTYGEASSTYTLGNKANPTVGSPSARTGGGRKVSLSAIEDGSVTATGANNATHFALVDTVNSRLLAAGPLGATVSVTGGNTFTLTAFDVGIPDPA